MVPKRVTAAFALMTVTMLVLVMMGCSEPKSTTPSNPAGSAPESQPEGATEFDPSSGHVVFLTQVLATDGSFKLDKTTVSVCRPDGSEMRDVATLKAAEHPLISWNSPYVAVWTDLEHVSGVVDGTSSSSQNGVLSLLDVKTGKLVEVDKLDAATTECGGLTDFTTFNDAPEREASAWQFSPRGDRLYYALWKGAYGGYSETAVKCYEIAAGKTTVIASAVSKSTSNNPGPQMRILCIAPDDSRMVVSSPDGMLVVNTDGSSPQKVPPTFTTLASPTMFSADAKQLYLCGAQQVSDEGYAVDVAADNSVSNSRPVKLLSDSSMILTPIHEAALFVPYAGSNTSYRLGDEVIELVATLDTQSGGTAAVRAKNLGFHPSGEGAAYVTDADGTPEVHIATAEKDTRITNDVEKQSAAQWCSW